MLRTVTGGHGTKNIVNCMEQKASDPTLVVEVGRTCGGALQSRHKIVDVYVGVC
jgi:hypothetical protein